jgi:hypothetical protein
MTLKELICKWGRVGGCRPIFDQTKELQIDLIPIVEKEIIDFAEWYSGMERTKVFRAYERYLKEKERFIPEGNMNFNEVGYKNSEIEADKKPVLYITCECGMRVVVEHEYNQCKCGRVLQICGECKGSGNATFDSGRQFSYCHNCIGRGYLTVRRMI